MADFNLNLLNYHSHQRTGEFLDIMYSNMFIPLITRPSRITYNSATLINNIFTKNLDTYSFSGLLFTDTVFWTIYQFLAIFVINQLKIMVTLQDM
jgi:hypothetical protein